MTIESRKSIGGIGSIEPRKTYFRVPSVDVGGVVCGSRIALAVRWKRKQSSSGAWRRLAASPQIRYHSTSWWSWAWQSQRCSSSAELNWKRPVESHELAVSDPTVAWLELDFFSNLSLSPMIFADAAPCSRRPSVSAHRV